MAESINDFKSGDRDDKKRETLTLRVHCDFGKLIIILQNRILHTDGVSFMMVLMGLWENRKKNC